MPNWKYQAQLYNMDIVDKHKHGEFVLEQQLGKESECKFILR